MRPIALLAALLWLAAPAPASAPEALERPPAVAGGFYPADPAVLKAQVDGFFSRAKVPPIEGKILAILTPHAGIEFSGLAAAIAFKAVDPAQVDTVLLLGTAHYARVEGAALYPGAYATPLGRAEYDAELGQALLKASPLIQAMPEAHQREHSIEVNVNFVQRRLPKAKVVALVMNTEDLATEQAIGAAVAAAVKGRRVLLVASSDLSHYPAGEVDDRVDSTTLHALESLDPGLFWQTSRLWMSRRLPNLECTYCGEGAVGAVMAAARALGATRAQVLARYNSGDALAEHNYGRVVGYAAAVFVRDPKAKPRTAYGLSAKDKKDLLAEVRSSIKLGLEGKPPPPAELSARPAFNLPAAVFVTLQTPAPGGEKRLRGCIGSTTPQGTLLEAVRLFSQAAAFEDHRFAPLAAQELDRVRAEISILSPTRPIKSADDIRPNEHGVTVAKDGHFGIFLPQVWEMIPEKGAFLAELCSQKAGLPRDCASDPKSQLSVFTVESFEEPWPGK